MADGDQTEWLNIGMGHDIAWREWKGDKHAILIHRHARRDGSLCEGHITVKGSKWAAEFGEELQGWDLVSLDPLTISPSLLCRICGDHGFIENGKWRKV